MIERLRGNDALSWGAIGFCALVASAACFIPAVELALSASIGAGDDQRAFRLSRELTLVPGLRPCAAAGARPVEGRPLAGWRVLEWLAVVVGVLTAYRAFRLALRPRLALALTALTAAAVWTWIVLEGLSGLQ